MLQAAKIFLIAMAAFVLAAQTTQATPDGETLYLTHCASCHQADGSGWNFEIPSLTLSKKLRGKKITLIEFVLHGSDLRAGFVTESIIPMPAFEALTNDELAALLTYARDAFGEQAGAVTANEIAEGRLVLGQLLQNRKKDQQR